MDKSGAGPRNTIFKARQEDKANTPDCELGNPFKKRGLGKTVYKPRRRR